MNEREKQLKEYLESMVKLRNSLPRPPEFKYCSIEELVLDEGKLLSRQPFTEEEERLLLRLFRGPYKTKECYYNALMLMMASGDLKYTEGIASGHVIPVTHAWVTLNGKPVDVTWGEKMIEASHNRVRSAKKLLKRARYNLENNSYWGISFPDKAVTTQVVETGLTPAMLDDWMGGHPLLKTGIPDEWKEEA